MSDSFYVEKLLNMKESKSLRAVHPPNTSLRYPTEFCFLEHQECKEHGVPGFYEGTYHFLDCTQNRSTSWNLIPLSHLSNASNNSPSISNMPRRDCSENPVLKSFNSFQKHIFPKWHTISKYPEKTRNNSTFFPELTRKLSKNGDVQNRCTAILDAVPSTSKAAQQNNSTIPQQAKNSFEKLQQQMECLSRILPTERQNMSRTTCINGILNEWRQHILEMHPDHTPSSFETFKEAFMRDPMSVPVQNPNAFRGWYSQLSTSLGEPEKKEEITPESAGKKRRRTTFTSAQLIHLENNYSLENRYLTRLKRIQLAAELGLSEKQVKVWFQNRRVRDKPKEDIKVNKHMRGRKIKSQDLEVKEEMP